MSKARVKKTILAGISLSQFEEALSEYAGADARTQEINAKLDAEMTKIRDKYAEELSYLGEKMKQNFEILNAYCNEQKGTLFVKRKSMHTIYGVLGFRLGNYKLKTIRGNTWAKITEKLKTLLPDYVRTTEEPAKDLLLADRKKEGVAEHLQELGLQVVQDETFFVEMKREEGKA